MTWTALLARWMDLAKSARALDGGWDRAMPSLITFEALAQAMGCLHQLPAAERSYAIDQARTLLELRLADLEDFPDTPQAAIDAADAARAAIENAVHAQIWTIVWEGPGFLTMPEVTGTPARHSDEGAMAMMPPGTLALPGTPLAWWTGRHEPMLAMGIAGCRAVPTEEATQVWRVFGADHKASEDRVRSINDEGPADAMPLLIPRVAGGQRLATINLPEDWPPGNEQLLPEGLPPVRWDIDWQ